MNIIDCFFNHADNLSILGKKEQLGENIPAQNEYKDYLLRTLAENLLLILSAKNFIQQLKSIKHETN